MAILSDDLREELKDNVLQREHDKLIGDLKAQLAQEHHWDEQQRHWLDQRRHWKRQRIIWTVTALTAIGTLLIGFTALVLKALGWLP